jgi:Bacterial alpha-L-rhamnosidase C-terminal domain/Domain of Unknown Function (DUF1080)
MRSKSGYRFVLGADNDTLSGFAPSNTTPNTLLAFQQNTNDQLGVVSLASLGIDIKPGTWHKVKAVVSGETVNTYLDGQLVLSFNVTEPKEQNSTGSVGLGNGSGAEALFRNLSVQAAGGQTLYTSTLVTNTVLDEFSTGTNAVASVIDGAKRDRYCWSGDLAVAGPLIYYTTSGLSKYVLGVRPVSPGYKTWLIEPQPGDLTWAKGRVSTPYGPIKVKWEKTHRGLRLEIEVPSGTSGSVGLPTSSNADSLTDNGRPVRKLRKIAPTSASDDISGARSGYAYLADIGAGAHVIQVTETNDD